MKKNNETQKVVVQPLKLGRIDIDVVGKTSLLMEKMNMDVVEKYNQKKGKKVSGTEDKMEEELVDAKIHYDSNGNVAYPSTAFLKGMVEVAPYIDGLDKKKVRGSVRILDAFIPLNYKKKVLNVTWGKTSGMTRAPRKIIRPEFTDWDCKLRIEFNEQNISAEQILNLLRWAGFQMGVGGWRPEHSGVYGQYKIK